MESVTGELLAVIATKLDDVCMAVTNVEKAVGILQTEITSVRTELKEEIASVRTELKEEIASVRTELKEEITSVRTELKEEIASVRTELKQDMTNLEANLKNEIKIQIEKSNKELSDYMVEDIIPILNDLDARVRTLEEKQIVVAEENAEYHCDTENN